VLTADEHLIIPLSTVRRCKQKARFENNYDPLGRYFDGMYRSAPTLIEAAFDPAGANMGTTDGEHGAMTW